MVCMVKGGKRLGVGISLPLDFVVVKYQLLVHSLAKPASTWYSFELLYIAATHRLPSTQLYRSFHLIDYYYYYYFTLAFQTMKN